MNPDDNVTVLEMRQCTTGREYLQALEEGLQHDRAMVLISVTDRGDIIIHSPAGSGDETKEAGRWLQHLGRQMESPAYGTIELTATDDDA